MPSPRDSLALIGDQLFTDAVPQRVPKAAAISNHATGSGTYISKPWSRLS